MLPTASQLEQFKWTCSVITSTGAALFCRSNKSPLGKEMVVTIYHQESNKIYHFADPDIEVITKQLKQLLNVLVTS